MIVTLDQLKTCLQAVKDYISKIDTYTLTATDKQEIAGMVLPALPSTDGSYVLTVTLSSGEPTYTWQLQS